jgi:23S rRNA (uracil1939-C5)-methyltransferase
MTNSDKKPQIQGFPAQADLEITDLSHEGQGIGRHQGMIIFVPGGLPGDRTRVTIERQHSRYLVGRPIKLLRPSPDRIEPLCTLASRCGGCTLQALSYPAQLRLKQQQVCDALQRIGHLDSQHLDQILSPIIGMDHPWHYRAKVQFPIAGTSQQPAIGFYAQASHQVVPGSVCAIQPPVCDRIRETVRRHIQDFDIEPYHEDTHSGLLRHLIIRLGMNTGEIMVVLVINGDTLPGQMELWHSLQEAVAAENAERMRNADVQPDRQTQMASEPAAALATLPNERPHYQLVCYALNINRAKTNLIQSDDIRLLAGRPWIEEVLLGVRYRISPLAFFQVNPVQAERLFATAVQYAHPAKSETILDLYCGTGSIALQLAREAGHVIGVEISEAAIADAQINAEANGIDNVRFLAGSAETILPQLVTEGLTADCIVVDPPRKGCDPSLIDTLINILPQRIVYVSCNPATLARDIALLAPAGYTVRAVQPVDMFPWTMHVETVVLMCRGDAGKA